MGSALLEAMARAAVQADTESEYNERLQCFVQTILVSGNLMTVTTGHDSVPDMTGAVELAGYISPSIRYVAFFNISSCRNTFYERGSDGAWSASAGVGAQH